MPGSTKLFSWASCPSTAPERADAFSDARSKDSLTNDFGLQNVSHSLASISLPFIICILSALHITWSRFLSSISLREFATQPGFVKQHVELQARSARADFRPNELPSPARKPSPNSGLFLCSVCRFCHECLTGALDSGPSKDRCPVCRQAVAIADVILGENAVTSTAMVAPTESGSGTSIVSLICGHDVPRLRFLFDLESEVQRAAAERKSPLRGLKQ